MVVEGEETIDLTQDSSDSRKLRRVDSGSAIGGAGEEADSVDSGGASVEKVSFGLDSSTAQEICGGLTRENGASHLQKYRLFVKWIHGSSNEGPSSSDPLFASATIPRVFTIHISRYYINFWGRIQRLG
ncbi:unnamed protein product [Lactuca virosa]|uniref:Uncharacterized protein n=1 Tax=Lactuca virosa TaxID=75947 RepID=A0AAU9NKR6_9ASTR|nr:unnamed protein product [Lactuca virosa]